MRVAVAPLAAILALAASYVVRAASNQQVVRALVSARVPRHASSTRSLSAAF